MKKTARIFVLVMAFAAMTVSGGVNGGFEGVIEFVKMTTTDTSNYAFYIKGNKVRIDNTVKGDIKGIMLVDLDKKSVLALSPDRKLYMDVNNSPINPGDKNNYEVIKTGNKKTIQGFPCEQVRVKNKSQNTEVMYWLAQGDFPFFPLLIQTVSRKENTSIYYLVMDDVQNSFPFLAVENSLLREERARMEVTKITTKSVDSKLFEVPEGYVKFEK